MSPLRIKMLLHYYACVNDYRDEVSAPHANSGAVAEAICFFLQHELIKEVNPGWFGQPRDSRNSQYQATEKGAAMVDHLCEIQIPVCQWVQP